MADYDEDFATARLYCESRIYEVLSLMVYYATDQVADVPYGDYVRPKDEEAIQEVTQYIKDHCNFNLTLALVSKIAGYSNPSRFTELFKRYYGFNPSKYR